MSEAVFGVKVTDHTQAGGASAGRTFDEIRRKAAAANQTLGHTDRQVRGLGASMGQLGAAFGISMGIAGFTSLLRSSTLQVIGFRKSMAEVSTLLSDTRPMATLTKEVEKLSVAFGSDVQVQAKALYQIISAGATDAADAMNVLTAANRLALGGVTDVATAADGLTTILNAWGMSADKATDVSDAMFVAMRAGKTTIGELSQYTSFGASIFAQAGLSMEELLGATAALTKGGVPTSRAMRGLAQVIASIIKPSDEAQKMAGKLGLQFTAQGLAAKGLAGFLADVGEKTGYSSVKMAQLFGGIEALGPVLGLTGTLAKDFNVIMADMERKTGQTEVAVAKMEETQAMKLDRLVQKWESAQRSIGGAILAMIDDIERLNKVSGVAAAGEGSPGFVQETWKTGGGRALGSMAAGGAVGSIAGPYGAGVGAIAGFIKSLAETINAKMGWEDFSADAVTRAAPRVTKSSDDLAGSLDLAAEAAKALAASDAEAAQRIATHRRNFNPNVGVGPDEPGFALNLRAGVVPFQQRPVPTFEQMPRLGGGAPDPLTLEIRNRQLRLEADMIVDVTRRSEAKLEVEQKIAYEEAKRAGASGVQLKALADLQAAEMGITEYRNDEASALDKAQAQQLAYERALRSGLQVLERIAPESQAFFESAASFFSGDILGGTLNLIGGIIEHAGLLKDTSAELRAEIARMEAQRTQARIRSGSEAAGLFESLNLEGYQEARERALAPIRQLFEAQKAKYPDRTEFQQMELFLRGLGDVSSTFASIAFDLSGKPGLTKLITGGATGMEGADKFDAWQEAALSTFGGSGSVMDLGVAMLEEMAGAVEGVGVAAKATTAALDAQQAAQRLQLAGEEMRIRSEFQGQFQRAGGDVLLQSQVYKAMMQQVNSLTYRSGTGGVATAGGGGGTTGAGKPAAGSTGGTIDASGVTVQPLVTTASVFIELPTEGDFTDLYMNEGGLANRMTAGLETALQHYRGVLLDIHLKPYGDDALLPTNFLEFPTADEFLVEHGGEGGGKVGSLADSMPNGIHGAMQYYRGVLAQEHLKPYGDDALLPWDFIEFPTADEFLAIHGGEGGGMVGSLADTMPDGIHGAMQYYRGVLLAGHLKPYGDDALTPWEFIEFPTAEEFGAIHGGEGGGAVGSLSDLMPDGIHGAMAYYRGVLADEHLKPTGDDALRPEEFIEFPSSGSFMSLHGDVDGGSADSLSYRMTRGIHGAMQYYRLILADKHLKPSGTNPLRPDEFLRFPSEDAFHALHGYGAAGGSSTSLQFLMTRGIPDAMSYYSLILANYQRRPRPQDFVVFPSAADFFYYFADQSGAIATAIQNAMSALMSRVSPVRVDLSRFVQFDTSGMQAAVAAAVNEGVRDRTITLSGGGSYTPY